MAFRNDAIFWADLENVRQDSKLGEGEQKVTKMRRSGEQE